MKQTNKQPSRLIRIENIFGQNCKDKSPYVEWLVGAKASDKESSISALLISRIFESGRIDRSSIERMAGRIECTIEFIGFAWGIERENGICRERENTFTKGNASIVNAVRFQQGNNIGFIERFRESKETSLIIIEFLHVLVGNIFVEQEREMGIRRDDMRLRFGFIEIQIIRCVERIDEIRIGCDVLEFALCLHVLREEFELTWCDSLTVSMDFECESLIQNFLVVLAVEFFEFAWQLLHDQIAAVIRRLQFVHQSCPFIEFVSAEVRIGKSVEECLLFFEWFRKWFCGCRRWLGILSWFCWGWCRCAEVDSNCFRELLLVRLQDRLSIPRFA